VSDRLSDEEIDFAIRMVDALPESEQMIAYLRAQAATFEAHLGAARERISTLEALTDQLAPAAALIAEVDSEPYYTIELEPDDKLWDQCHPTVQQVLDARSALRAYEADKEAHR
jgi:hypothetical protein